MEQISLLAKQIYLSGTHGQGRYIKHKLGQPRVVLAITGGGGSIFSQLFGNAGASSCILEACIPYSKNSCLDFLKRQKRDAEDIGFCSEDMAWRLAQSSRDRALHLENDLNRWPDVHGVGCTATIVSHYKRRGGYRVHAAAVNARGEGSMYTHEMVKGARDRKGEDVSCSLLAGRALADSCGITFDETVGIRTNTTTVDELGGLSQNEVGEEADGIEKVPIRINASENQLSSSSDAIVLVNSGNGNGNGNENGNENVNENGNTTDTIIAPKGALPEDSIIVWCKDPLLAKHATETAQKALELLGRGGDGETGSWAVLPAPVFIVANEHSASDIHTVATKELENIGVLVMGKEHEDDATQPLMSSARAYPDATYVIEYHESTQQLNDGSPSTIDVNGVYVGTVTAMDTSDEDNSLPLPHGHGTMTWDNGISYTGSWTNGKFHGYGAKMYSKGGGYVGSWRFGQRQGDGISLFDGKFGYEQWTGEFNLDKADGVGVMQPEGDGDAFVFEFLRGEPVPPPPPPLPPQ